MRISSLILSLMFAPAFFGQNADVHGARREHYRTMFRDMFWSESDEGFFVGPTLSFERSVAAVGGEVKYYGAYYHYLFSGSLYANARRLLVPGSEHQTTAINLGVHYTIFGLEANTYLDKERTVWGLTPKVGVDTGSLSLFYGYGFAISPGKGAGHTLSLKYAVNLSEFGLYRP